MATFNSTQFANGIADPVVQNPPTDDEGRVRWKFATLPANHGNTLAQDDFINLFKLPKDCRPLEILRTNGAFGASVTLDVGFSGDEDAFESAVSVAAAQTTPVLGVVDDISVLTSEVTVQAKLEGANPPDDQELTIGISYVMA